jgi:hypothetical protein
MMMNLTKRASSHVERFPKILFALSRCRIAEDDGSRDLLSQSQVHAGDRDEVVLAAQQQRRRNASGIRVGWDNIFYAAAVRIYSEKPPRVKASRNRLGFHIKNALDT